MTVKHTPGPWQVVGGAVYGNGLRAALPMNSADARLMAAGPVMLEALRKIEEATVEGGNINKIARAAIAAATST